MARRSRFGGATGGAHRTIVGTTVKPEHGFAAIFVVIRRRVEELHRDDFMTVTFDAGRVSLSWQREEPNDDHAVATSKTVQAALDRWLDAHPDEKVAVLVDLMVVKKNFPRAIASFTGWLLSHRHRIKVGAFATKSFLLRAGLTTAILVPGLTMKGFGDVDSATKFLDSKS